MHNIILFSDVHSNIHSLRAAYGEALVYINSTGGTFEFVFLGDLLTYGVDAQEVLELLSFIQSSCDTTFILGNHDQLYIDLICGVNEPPYFIGLPSWIKESVLLNLGLIDKSLFMALPFEPFLVRGDAVFVHANLSPLLGLGLDWSYVNTLEQYDTQLSLLKSLKKRVMVFGHTHRAAMLHSVLGVSSPFTCFSPITYSFSTSVSVSDFYILNPGSLGQPRSKGQRNPFWMNIVMQSNETASFGLNSFSYDISSHLSRLDCSVLSSSTVSKLVGFFS